MQALAASFSSPDFARSARLPLPPLLLLLLLRQVDNLEIFHEGGAVFPPPELRSTFLSPEVMHRIAQYRRSPGMDN